MLITRRSMATGIIRTIDLPITTTQVMRYDAGAKIQDAFPACDADQREFYKTGIWGAEWDDMFPEEEADDRSSHPD
jgi:hypothetical protein